ncbi:MAG: hypothetical protein IJ785_00860 [Bacteroidales bacterium]|nr:hypothetical protein [Bacteroidales bacterium]
MKKTFLAALLLFCTVQASAQMFFGGNFRFDMASYNRTGGFDPTQPYGMALQFTPQVGYAFSSGVKMGVQLHIANQQYLYTNGFYNTDAEEWQKTVVTGKTLATFGGGLFLRLRCFEFKDLSMSMELSATYSYGIGAVRDTQYLSSGNFPVVFESPFRTHQLAMKLVPVFSYQLSDHFSAEAHVDLLSLLYTYSVTDKYKTIEKISYGNNYDPVIDNTTASSHFTAGINSLTSQLLTIGFIYTL